MRKEVAAVIKFTPEDVKDFLEQVAVPHVNRGWEFLLPSDPDFVKKHADVAHRQHMLWLGIQSKLEKVFNFSKDDLVPKNAPQSASAKPVHIGAHMSATRRNGLLSKRIRRPSDQAASALNRSPSAHGHVRPQRLRWCRAREWRHNRQRAPRRSCWTL